MIERDLQSFLDSHRGTHFVYGTFDCCLWVADWYRRQTGVDHSARFRGYDSKLAAYRLIKEGGGDLQAFVAGILDQQPQPPLNARPGWLVVYGTAADNMAVGVCLGANAVFLSEEDGSYVTRYLHECASCFEVKKG